MKNENISSSEFRGQGVRLIIAALLALSVTAAGIMFSKFIDSQSSYEYGDGFDIGVSETEYKEVYYAPECGEMFLSLSEPEEYTRNFRIIRSYGGTNYIETVKLEKNGKVYRIESDERLVYTNGEYIHIVCDEYDIKVNADEYDFFNEIGITPVSVLQADESIEPEFESDGRIISVTKDEDGIHREYEISAETGIVLSERYYYSGNAYLTIITDEYGAECPVVPTDDISGNLSGTFEKGNGK